MTKIALMSKVDHYLHAATRDNTRRSYQSAIEHFEVTWSGFLPTTADSVARYLADYGDSLAFNTLKQRLSALAQWHIDQGFPDPTKAPVVKKVMKGIKELHPAEEKRAKPLQLNQLNTVIDHIDREITNATRTNNSQALLRHLRNKALMLIGFWRGFRSDELSRLLVDHVTAVPFEGLTLFLPRTKTDRANQGRSYKTPALSRLCPVTAYIEWIERSGITTGPVFRKIDRWGKMGENPLNPSSITLLLRSIFEEADLKNSGDYSSHSLRRGFATWANDSGWDVKSLMEYVGWKDVKSAMRYIDSIDQYAKNKIESDLPKLLP